MSDIRLVYFSRALQDMSLMDIGNILETARSNNREQDICGMLCYESRWFLQALEGHRETVNELFLEIAEDPRHEDIVIASYEYTDTRLFKSWQMGYAGSSSSFHDTLASTELNTFDPPSMSTVQCLDFLQIMSTHQENQST